MANVLNPEPESITLSTEMETPSLDPATELEQPSFESTSNTKTAEAVAAVESTALDADALTEPVAQATHVEHATQVETTAEAAPAAVVQKEIVAPAETVPVIHAEA